MMKNGYLRLQAVIRSRILSHRFRHLRGHIIRLQARSRGFLIRREMAKKRWAVVKLQSHVRRMIAQRDYRKMKVERRGKLLYYFKFEYEFELSSILGFISRIF